MMQMGDMKLIFWSNRIWFRTSYNYNSIAMLYVSAAYIINAPTYMNANIWVSMATKLLDVVSPSASLSRQYERTSVK